ncbi:MAG TPA: hypothetical protein VF276_04235 [Chloroflexia bacterium]
MSVETNRTCKHCGLSYNVFNDVGSTGSYCTMCNAPTLIVVAFYGQRNSETAAHTYALRQANAFFAEFGIGREQFVFPPTTNTAPDTNEDWGAYTITYHLEVPAYVAQQIREARNA